MFRPLRILVNIIFYIIEVLLLIRFVLILLRANLANAFASWIFRSTGSLIAPFRDIFPSVNVGGLTVDFTTLFALVIYIIIGQLILRALFYIDNPRIIER